MVRPCLSRAKREPIKTKRYAEQEAVARMAEGEKKKSRLAGWTNGTGGSGDIRDRSPEPDTTQSF